MASAEGKTSWIKTNQGVSACLSAACLVLIIYLLNQEWVYQQLRDGFHLGFVPMIAAGAMLLCALAMLVDRHKRDTTPEMAKLKAKHWLLGLVALAICYAYFYFAWDIDFLLISPMFLALGSYLLGVRPLLSALIAGVVVGSVIFFLFRIIGIELPSMFF